MPILARCSYCDEPFERLFKFCPNCGLSVIGEGLTDKAGVAVRDLFEIAKTFSSVYDLDLLLKKISTTAEKLTRSEASSVMLLDDKKEYLYFKVAGGEKSHLIQTIKVPSGHGVAGWVAKKNEPLLIDDVSKDARFSAALADDKSGFITRSILCVPMTLQDEVIGVMEVLNKRLDVPGEGKFNNDDLDIMRSLAGFAAVSITNSKLSSDQKNFFANIMEILIAAIETKSIKNSAGHSWRVAQIACNIARRLKLNPQNYKSVYYAAILHDVGYIGVQRQMAEENTRIPSDKIEHMHPIVGAEMISTIRLLEASVPLIRAHHEMWDGSGFPDKIKGDSIPIGARILSFAEAIEDYRDQISDDIHTEDELRNHIEKFASENIDKAFDPQVVAAFFLEVSPTMGMKV